jgi:hypothetical protein
MAPSVAAREACNDLDASPLSAVHISSSHGPCIIYCTIVLQGLGAHVGQCIFPSTRNLEIAYMYISERITNSRGT